MALILVKMIKIKESYEKTINCCPAYNYYLIYLNILWNPMNPNMLTAGVRTV